MIVALTVLRSIGSIVDPRSPSRRRAVSVSRGFSSDRITVASLRGSSAATRSTNSRTTGVTCTGIRLRSRSRSSLPSLATVPPRCTSAPWPPGPRMVAFSQQICFSATWIG